MGTFFFIFFFSYFLRTVPFGWSFGAHGSGAGDGAGISGSIFSGEIGVMDSCSTLYFLFRSIDLTQSFTGDDSCRGRTFYHSFVSCFQTSGNHNGTQTSQATGIKFTAGLHILWTRALHRARWNVLNSNLVLFFAIQH